MGCKIAPTTPTPVTAEASALRPGFALRAVTTSALLARDVQRNRAAPRPIWRGFTPQSVIVYSLQMTPPTRLNRAETVVAQVRRMILNGALAPGVRINEVHLSKTLGVSRTPLREALNRLVLEGALFATPAIGYKVCPLTVEEFTALRAMRALLIPEALRLADLPAPSTMARLESLAQSCQAAHEVEAAVDLDDAWHRELLAQCPNAILLEQIAAVSMRTRRYELAFMRAHPEGKVASRFHERVMSALRAGDLPKACLMLQHNIKMALQALVTWLHGLPGAT
jgi:DNA-binding GntR family transcriptional regulator